MPMKSSRPHIDKIKCRVFDNHQLEVATSSVRMFLRGCCCGEVNLRQTLHGSIQTRRVATE